MNTPALRSKKIYLGVLAVVIVIGLGLYVVLRPAGPKQIRHVPVADGQMLNSGTLHIRIPKATDPYIGWHRVYNADAQYDTIKNAGQDGPSMGPNQIRIDRAMRGKNPFDAYRSSPRYGRKVPGWSFVRRSLGEVRFSNGLVAWHITTTMYVHGKQNGPSSQIYAWIHGGYLDTVEFDGVRPKAIASMMESAYDPRKGAPSRSRHSHGKPGVVGRRT